MWPQHLEKIGTRCSRLGAGRAAGRNSSSGQEEVGLCVCGEQWGSACHSGENTWLPSSPQFFKQAPLFLQTGAAKLFTDSKIRLVRRDNQAQGGTWDVPRKATSRPEICPCCPTGSSLLQASYLPPWQKPVYPEVCIQTRGKEQGRMRSFWQRKPDHEDPTIGQSDRLPSESTSFLLLNHVRCSCY